jgi:hypothetical protein
LRSQREGSPSEPVVPVQSLVIRSETLTSFVVDHQQDKVISMISIRSPFNDQESQKEEEEKEEGRSCSELFLKH